MIRNGFTDPIGDLWTGNAALMNGPSTFVAVTSLPNNSFVVFDSNRGRLFAYDSQGHLLYAWGGPGFREGFFQNPVALDSMGYALYALDSATGALTRFDLTEYGLLINMGLAYYQRGMYEESAVFWEEVLRINGNFGMAYIGIARSLLRRGYYREAMRYFRHQNDAINYGRAFGFYRRLWVEENFWIFALAVGVLIFVPPIVRKGIAIRKELKEA
jgi:tetratricopeptide (TPR) repeat protein